MWSGWMAQTLTVKRVISRGREAENKKDYPPFYWCFCHVLAMRPVVCFAEEVPVKPIVLNTPPHLLLRWFYQQRTLHWRKLFLNPVPFLQTWLQFATHVQRRLWDEEHVYKFKQFEQILLKLWNIKSSTSRKIQNCDIIVYLIGVRWEKQVIICHWYRLKQNQVVLP